MAHIVFGTSGTSSQIFIICDFLAAFAVGAAGFVGIVAFLNHNLNCYFMWFDGVQAIRLGFGLNVHPFRQQWRQQQQQSNPAKKKFDMLYAWADTDTRPQYVHC